jgi:hypothetical protein
VEKNTKTNEFDKENPGILPDTGVREAIKLPTVGDR